MLILYVTSSWPSVQECAKILSVLDKYADLIELGLPTRNPKYDGPTIRRTHFEAERLGIDALVDTLERYTPRRDVMLLCYYEDYRDRLDLLMNIASQYNIKTVLFPDLLFDYYEDLERYVECCRRHNIEPSFFISTKFPHNIALRLQEYKPYLIYLGVQAATGIELPLYVERNVRIFRKIVSKTRLVVGFAISRPEQIKKLLELKVDGVVIGSEIVRRYASGGLEEVEKFLIEIRKVYTC